MSSRAISSKEPWGRSVPRTQDGALMTQAEVADQLGISRQMVFQTEKAVLAKFRIALRQLVVRPDGRASVEEP